MCSNPLPAISNEVTNRQISSGYFSTLEARLLRGRYFREDEDLSKPLAAIVNRTLAEKVFAAEDPIGKRILRLAASIA